MIVTELNQIGISEGSKLPQVNRLLNLEVGNNLTRWQDQDMPCSLFGICIAN
jgi:hypothetical protein